LSDPKAFARKTAVVLPGSGAIIEYLHHSTTSGVDLLYHVELLPPQSSGSTHRPPLPRVAPLPIICCPESGSFSHISLFSPTPLALTHPVSPLHPLLPKSSGSTTSSVLNYIYFFYYISDVWCVYQPCAGPVQTINDCDPSLSRLSLARLWRLAALQSSTTSGAPSPLLVALQRQIHHFYRWWVVRLNHYGGALLQRPVLQRSSSGASGASG